MTQFISNLGLANVPPAIATLCQKLPFGIFSPLHQATASEMFLLARQPNLRRDNPELAVSNRSMDLSPQPFDKTVRFCERTLNQDGALMDELWGHTKAKLIQGVALGIRKIVVLTVCVNGLLHSDFEICKVETVTTKDGPTVTKTCTGPSVTDAGVVAVALLIVLALAPDMSEVGVFGLSLKTRLKATEEKANRLESQLQMQNLRVDTLSQNSNSASAQGIGQLIITTPDQIRQVDSDMAEKVKTFNWDAATNGRMMVVGATMDPIEVSPIQLIVGKKSIQGWYSGIATDSEDTLKFAEMTGVRPMIEKFPLEKVAEAYARMMSGKAQFRVVLTM